MTKWLAQLNKELKVLQPQFRERFMQSLIQELNIAKHNFPELTACNFRRESFDVINITFPVKITPTPKNTLRTGRPYTNNFITPKPPNKKDLQEIMKVSIKNALRTAITTVER